jgi:hypothetical protein
MNVTNQKLAELKERYDLYDQLATSFTWLSISVMAIFCLTIVFLDLSKIFVKNKTKSKKKNKKKNEKRKDFMPTVYIT